MVLLSGDEGAALGTSEMEGFRGNFVEICTACEIHSFLAELVKNLPHNSLITHKSRPQGKKNTVNITFDFYSILVMLTPN